ncbi:MAG TPA: hypothetical protein VFL41_10450 [Gaiellaceae bacterium]|nr:hypothetical protein [Gaiellaceae bacterium]
MESAPCGEDPWSQKGGAAQVTSLLWIILIVVLVLLLLGFFTRGRW